MSVTRLDSDHGPPKLASQSAQTGTAQTAARQSGAPAPRPGAGALNDLRRADAPSGPAYTEISDEEIEAQLDEIVERVDADLTASGLRLTMGGEPTFVHYDNPDAPEWNLDALGADKRILAARLTYRLMRAFAPGGVLYHGQGKWYPGEELPRWALGVFFRVDGQPLWRRTEYLARESGRLSTEQAAGDTGGEASGKDSAGAKDVRNPPKLPDARAFLHELALQLGLDPEATMLPAFEDSFYQLWLNGATFDPAGPQPEALREIFERTENTEAGYVLPLQYNPARSPSETAAPAAGAKSAAPDSGADWLSCRWRFKRGAVYLIPGDSPLGYRLPLNRIPNEFPAGYEHPAQPDPTDLNVSDVSGESGANETGRPDASDAAAGGASRATVNPPDPIERRVALRRGEPPASRPAKHIFVTAVNVEIRDGLLRVFLPPLTELEAYYDLVASIEATAVARDQAVILEGYPPPGDPRLNRLMVTPDPGVIEVNVHPARSWAELKETTRILYRCAREERLIAEKFELDGRPMGTGGGNHITLGGQVPAESPFLRRPDILRSMITYWQHHPSLSYLFSGLFVGPTSQAPRIDEARHEGLYDLELGFKSFAPFQTADAADSFTIRESQWWLIDRLLRNVLVDLTGNTHRSEFCIDKLFPGYKLSTRLGLLELRAFEMSPGPSGYLAMMSLVRALVARFAKAPYHKDFIRWGTHLHDQFMLPYFLWRDFAAVIADLNEHGYKFRLSEHFARAFEFRFPLYGVIQVEGVRIELRAAMEPWPVLGETSSAGGMSRPVDAALERLQIRVEGLKDRQHLLTCNGKALPLEATGTPGEYVAGVRFKAWAPPNTLHPLAPVHAPLTVDLL
ncbi:MAG: transglutaminase family protein, partial [Leptospirales bacterium]